MNILVPYSAPLNPLGLPVPLQLAENKRNTGPARLVLGEALQMLSQCPKLTRGNAVSSIEGYLGLFYRRQSTNGRTDLDRKGKRFKVRDTIFFGDRARSLWL